MGIRLVGIRGCTASSQGDNKTTGGRTFFAACRGQFRVYASYPRLKNREKCGRFRPFSLSSSKRIPTRILDKNWTDCSEGPVTAVAMTLRDSVLDTRTARLRRKQSGKPYYRAIDADPHLGCRLDEAPAMQYDP